MKLGIVPMSHQNRPRIPRTPEGPTEHRTPSPKGERDTINSHGGVLVITIPLKFLAPTCHRT